MNEQHLAFIQNNISRMNQCSFQIKGWTITIVAALLAVFAATFNNEGLGNNWYIFIAIGPTLFFWFLDSYYLSLEKKFVDMYNDAINENSKVIKFEIPIEKYNGCKYCVIKQMFSTSEIFLYGSIIVSLIVFGIFA